SRDLERLAAMPAGRRPVRWEPEPYPPGVTKAALLALEEAGAADRSGVSARVLEIMAVLPGSGVDRGLLHAAGEAGVLAKNRRRPEVSAELVDVALARLAERSLLAVGVDGKTDMAERLAVHIVRDQLTQRVVLVADSQRVLGPDHPDTLTAQNNLAVAYQEAGRAAEAIPLFVRSLEALERRLGPDHRDAMTTRNNLAVAYREAGRPAEAIPLLE